VTGRIPSKKNELVAVVDRNDAFKLLKEKMAAMPDVMSKKQAANLAISMLFKTFGKIVNSKDYQKWESDTVEILKEQLSKNLPAAQKHGLIFPLSKASVSIKFYWKGKYRRDNSNKAEGLHDALVKANILLDDSDKVIPDTSHSARDYSSEILKSIAVMYITTPIK
jgi:Holliday junction resolvase RusA-like endonuclease